MHPTPLAFYFMALTAAARVAAADPYAIVDAWKVGGEGKWDYPSVDVSSHRLYLSRETHVLVVDTQSGSVVGDILDTPGVHGIAVASDVGRGFISLGKSNQVKVFELSTLKVISTLEVGTKPDAILYDVYSHQVFAFNGHSNNVSVIDAKTMTVVTTIALGGGPEFGQSDGAGTIFVNIESKNELAVLDARRHTVTAHWPLPGCEGPTGLALDVAHHRTFSVCANGKMSILDSRTGQSIAIVPIGLHADGAAFDSDRQDAFSSNGDGTLTIVHESDADHFNVTQTLKTLPGSKTMALDGSSHKTYLPANGDAFSVLVISPTHTP
jgi:YVTN family beta-propeller protein